MQSVLSGEEPSPVFLEEQPDVSGACVCSILGPILCVLFLSAPIAALVLKKRKIIGNKLRSTFAGKGSKKKKTLKKGAKAQGSSPAGETGQ